MVGSSGSKSSAFDGDSLVSPSRSGGGKKKIVVVFINGFLSPNNWLSYPVEMIPPHIEMISVYPSPTGSFHDRVCQIFYELKGGTVDYGEEHSHYHGHHRYGKTFVKGKYPQWNADNPIVLIGHSLGGMTAWVFQNYLAERRFPGHDTDASWIKSLIGVTSPYNGTLKVYETGIRLNQPPIFHWATPGYWISFMVHLGESFNYRPWLDLDERQWMVWLGSPHSILLCILMLCGYGMHSATDNTAFDTTIHSNLVWNHALNTYPDTFYFSIVGKVNKEVEYEEEDHRIEKTDSRTTPYKVLRFLMKLFHIPAPKYIAGIPTEHWLHQGTDGVVCTFAQEFPRVVANRYKSEEVRRLKGKKDIEAGIWYYSHRNISHVCTSFMCEKTWSYILHVVEDLEQRHQEKVKNDQQMEQSIDNDQKRNAWKSERKKGNTSHLFDQYKPDMQDSNLVLEDYHDCSVSTSLPWSHSNFVIFLRITAIFVFCGLLIQQLLIDQSLLSTPPSLQPSSMMSCLANISSSPVVSSFSAVADFIIDHKLVLMLPAMLSVVLQGLIIFVSISDKWERTSILPLLCWETCQSFIRATVLCGGLLGLANGSATNTFIPLLPSMLRWSWFIEGVGNAAFGMEKAPVLQPALKLGTGIVTANLLQSWISSHYDNKMVSITLLALVSQQLLMMFPSLLWIGIHEMPVQDRGDGKYSIRMGYIMGGLFFVIVSLIAMTIAPILFEMFFAQANQASSFSPMVVAPAKLWIALQCVWSFIKYSDFTHYVTFVLIKVRFLFYRMEEWEASKNSKDFIPMRMLD